MNKLLYILFGIVFVLATVLGVLYERRGGLVFLSKDKINFISSKSGFEWEVNEDFVRSLEELIRTKEGSESKKVLVVLSSEFKQTPEGGGYGELEPFVYAEWSSSGNRDTLNIYLDGNIWKQIEEKKRNTPVSYLISQQILQHFEMTDEPLEKITEDIFNNGPKISIKESSIF
ncbi:hypothetical protein MUP46_01475 [Patescibacteria group bacterium]|nr:hypothetical protein [Patescibacteria group bacterium]